MDLLGNFFQLVNWLTLVFVAVAIFGVVDAAIRPAAAYVAAGKLTKPAWLIILALAAAALFLGALGLFGIAGMVAVIVYLVDVRPALKAVGGGRSGSSGSVGPYGPW